MRSNWDRQGGEECGAEKVLGTIGKYSVYSPALGHTQLFPSGFLLGEQSMIILMR